MKTSLLYFFAREKELRAKGEKVIGFTLTSPEFPPPESLKEKILNVYERSFPYTPSGGDFEFRERLAVFYSRKWNTRLKKGNVFVGNGGKEILFILLQCILKKGGEAIIVSPYWSSYPHMVESAKGKVKFFRTSAKEGFYLDVKKLEKMISPKTKLVIVNSPCNPTGSVLKEKDVAFLSNLSLKKKFILVADEVYESYDFENKYCSFLKFFHQNIFCVFSASKGFSLCGWRLGWGMGNEKLVAEMINYQSNLSTSPHTLSQLVINEFFKNEEEMNLYLLKNKKEARDRRDLTAAFLKEKNIDFILPEGGIAIFIKIPPAFSASVPFVEDLLNKEKVSVAPGEVFGEKKYFRINLSVNMEDLKEGLNKIAKYYAP